MQPCMNHPNVDADNTCASCHEPICSDCSVPLNDGKFLCPNCLRNEIRNEIDEATYTQSTVKKELIFILIGLVFGFVLVFASGINTEFIYVKMIPWVFASLFSIVRKIINFYKSTAEVARGDSEFRLGTTLIVSLFYIMISPLYTLYRVIKRLLHYRKLQGIINTDQQTLNDINNYLDNVERLRNVGSIDLASNDDEEVTFDFSDLKDNVQYTDSGEIIRNILYS